MSDRGGGRVRGALTPLAGVVVDLGEASEMIALKHSVFALPFALAALITADGAGWCEPTIRAPSAPLSSPPTVYWRS